MRKISKKMLIVVMVTTLIFSGLSPMFFATAAPEPPQWPKILHIEWVDPESILEGNCEFEVKVVNIGDPAKPNVENAWVMADDPYGPDFNPEQTGSNGIAEFDQYMTVDNNTTFTVYASKDGWTFDGINKYLTVRNRVLRFHDIPEWMYEQSWDEVTVYDQDNVGAPWALVNFGGFLRLTDSNGDAGIYAFDVTADDVFEDPWVTVPITANKGTHPPYEPAVSEIRVKDLDDTWTHVDFDVKSEIGGTPIEGAIVENIGGQGAGVHENITDAAGYCKLSVLPDEAIGRLYAIWASHHNYWSGCKIRWWYAGVPYEYDFNLVPKGGPGNYLDLEVTSATYDEIWTVDFEATTQGQAESVSYDWDFGDESSDSTASGINSHDYVEPDNYIVKVTATYSGPYGPCIEYGQIGLDIGS